MNPMTIRPATPCDLEAVVAVEHAADAQFASVGLGAVLAAPQAGVADHAPAQADGRLFVAESGPGRVIGFARVDLVDGEPHIEQVSVHPEASGNRVGAQLMETCEQWAAVRGHDRITLCTYRDVPWNGAYYQRLGWAVLPEAEQGPELRALRQLERRLGLEVQPRQVMAKSLRSALVRRLEQVDGLNSVALARVLRDQDPSWGTRTQPVGGGQLVLCGPGLYVNRAIAAGLTERLTAADLDLIIDLSAAVGVPPEVEVTAATHPESLVALTARGFGPDADPGTSVHVHPLENLTAESPRPDIRVVSVRDRSLEEWQEVSAAGWGHDTEAARRAADAFARAARVVDGDGMVLALDADDGRPLGCASLTIHDEVATLGGMSTLPAERGRGVQRELIRHRLGVARDAGCTLAMTTTAVGGASERNMRRFGFTTTHVKHAYCHQVPAE